jgi:hypothetical protein
VAEQAVNGKIDLIQSDRAYDWLGPGFYIWESDEQRAREWAEAKVRRGDYAEAAVIGAAIDLGNCLDLVSRHDLELVRGAYRSLVKQHAETGLQMPTNRGVGTDPDDDRVLRLLDCAVIKHLHAMIESVPLPERVVPAFDTVRGMFGEGGQLYPGGGFRERSHVQIAVRNMDCVKGIFFPR